MTNNRIFWLNGLRIASLISVACTMIGTKSGMIIHAGLALASIFCYLSMARKYSMEENIAWRRTAVAIPALLFLALIVTGILSCMTDPCILPQDEWKYIHYRAGWFLVGFIGTMLIITFGKTLKYWKLVTGLLMCGIFQAALSIALMLFPADMDMDALTKGEKLEDKGKTVIMYFGRTENTDWGEDIRYIPWNGFYMIDEDKVLGKEHIVAETVRTLTGGTAYCINKATPYNMNWITYREEMNKEIERKKHIPLLPPFPDFKDVDRCVIIYSVWNHDGQSVPEPVLSFLRSFRTEMKDVEILPISIGKASLFSSPMDEFETAAGKKTHQICTMETGRIQYGRQYLMDYLNSEINKDKGEKNDNI